MEKDIRRYVRTVLSEITSSDIPFRKLPLSQDDLKKIKSHFDNLNEHDQWVWLLYNYPKIAYVSIDEDRATATFKGDESNFRENIYSKYPLVFKSGGGYRPIPHILGHLGMKIEIV